MRSPSSGRSSWSSTSCPTGNGVGPQRHRSTTGTAASSAGCGSSCAVTTIGLVIATWFALKERSYSAVMAATGLLYLAILTGFGMDLLPRALLG